MADDIEINDSLTIPASEVSFVAVTPPGGMLSACASIEPIGK